MKNKIYSHFDGANVSRLIRSFYPRDKLPKYLHIYSSYLVSTKGLELITCLSLVVTLSVFISLLFPLYQIMYIFSIKFVCLFVCFIDQSGDAILDCSTDRPIGCCVSFNIKTLTFPKNESFLYFQDFLFQG